MRVLINCMVLSDRSGVGGTSRALIELLKSMAQLAVPHDVKLLCSPDGLDLIPPTVPFDRITSPSIVGRGAGRLLYEHSVIPLQVLRAAADVLHSPTYVSPIWTPCASVVTVHDMTWYSHAGLHRDVKRRYFQALIPRSVRSSQVTIVDSECTRREVLAYVRVPEERVVTVYLGVDHNLFRPPSASQVSVARATYALESPYVVTVAQVHPRKNHAVVLRALESLMQTRKAPTYAIVGKGLWGIDELRREVSERGLEQHVRFLGLVPDVDLPALYAGSSAVIYPSLYEGFGLPVLEAMACGSVCIVSNSSSLPEVGGDAVLYFEPRDHKALAQQLVRALDDASLATRLRGAGIDRAGTFSWDRTAKAVVHAYELAYRRRGKSRPAAPGSR